MTVVATKKTFCSICSAFCGFDAQIEDDTIVAMVPDSNHPMSRGFSCAKGRQFHHLLTADNRLTVAMRRVDGELASASSGAVLDEVAERLNRLRREYGPTSIAVYCGNGVTFKTTTMPAVRAWLDGIGSHHLYSPITIDQPAKIIAGGRIGMWAGGVHDFESSDVAMIIGNNPVVSGLNVPGGAPGWRPAAIKEAKSRGLKLIVVDPRRTATANLADLHLQIRPGEDATLLAGMVKLIIDEERYDGDFCTEFVADLDELHVKLAPFTLGFVARRTGLKVPDIERAIDLFTDGRRGTVSSATGPDMGPHGNVAEHLINTLNVLCGRYNRAGEVNEHLAVLMEDLPPVAALVPPALIPDQLNPDANTKKSRLAGASQVFQEMPTSTLSDEILAPGDGQIRALIVIGGSPVTSWPDQDKTLRALQNLDTLVCIEVRQTDTVALADYVLPASYGLERAELNAFGDMFYNKPFVQFTDPVVAPPGEACEEWIYLAELAKRMGTRMTMRGGEVDLDDLPSPRDFLKMIYPEGTTRVPLDDILGHPGGKVFDEFSAVEVLPKFDGMNDRFQLLAAGVAEEIDTLLAYPIGEEGHFGPGGEYTHLLTCRRSGRVYNSMCHELPKTEHSNPAYLHPDDLKELGARDGQTIRMMSAYGVIDVEARVDTALRRGVVSMSHGFGSALSGEQNTNFGAVSRLLSTDNTLDRVARMPIMSAVPVRFAPYYDGGPDRLVTPTQPMPRISQKPN